MKRFISIIGIFLALIGFSAPVYSWGPATHAYIGARLGEKGILGANVLYGQMAGDVFNLMYDTPIEQIQHLYDVTHGLTEQGLDTVFPVLDLAETKREKAVALGFLAHNNVNGADVYAHGNPYNDPERYVIAKALQLSEVLASRLALLGGGIADDMLLEVSHVFVEFAADLLIRQYDRAIGARMIVAAISRNRGFPDLLVKAYAENFADTFGFTHDEAASIIVAEEAKFRRLAIRYGMIMQYSNRKAQTELAGLLAEIAPRLMEGYGLDVPSAMLLPIIQFGIGEALELCKDDLLPEVENTIEALRAIDWHHR
ncbi:hypothetical protein [Methylotuvimicrobium buryatense]|uniref:Uncharacterized protein n=1 Tax=Methylotuvimicrobium buryatense TaxID=95641 RepID=A0A4P9USI4_METBY|nr:hypothetical protein [Methylotuvimicrobium buryatense]QCW83490.1 hypothetical protein EQU24_15485 [Methylotuvimicrobium buryatense]